MATHSVSSLNKQYEYREIDLALLDEPDIATRETMDPEQLGNLAMSIKQEGLIKPLVVRERGERFSVVAGHRRLLACRIAEYTPVPCRVFSSDIVDELAILEAENAYTEGVNAIEQARFYVRLLEEKCGNDVDALCNRVHRKREFVEDRLLLLQGYPEVVEALANKRIGIAVARELNKVPDFGRLLILLDAAANQGATARQVMAWRRDAELMPAIGTVEELQPDSAGEGNAAAAGFHPECLFCEDGEDLHLMEMVYLHKPCKRVVEKMLGRDRSAGPAGGR